MASKHVTAFGGSGFLGRQIVKSLVVEGVSIRVAVRHPERASFLKRVGQDGQIELVRANVWEKSTGARAVKKSTWSSILSATMWRKAAQRSTRYTGRAPTMSPGKPEMPVSSG